MGDGNDGLWQPAPIDVVERLMAALPVRWWFSGGIALELHLGRRWRAHDDTDVGICRIDAPLVLDHLRRQGLETFVGAAGRLRSWTGGDLLADDHENNVWCRRPGGPWELDITLGDGNADEWIYRRDPTLRLPWPRAVLHTDTGLPYLAPELQLLFKSVHVRDKDTLDAHEVVPVLTPASVRLLRDRLPVGHPWTALVAR